MYYWYYMFLKDRAQTAETNKYLLILRTNDVIKCYSSSFRDSKYDLMSCFNSFGVYFLKINNPSSFLYKWLSGLYLCLTNNKCH